jgi:hypothetical protein
VSRIDGRLRASAAGPWVGEAATVLGGGRVFGLITLTNIDQIELRSEDDAWLLFSLSIFQQSKQIKTL